MCQPNNIHPTLCVNPIKWPLTQHVVLTQQEEPTINPTLGVNPTIFTQQSLPIKVYKSNPNNFIFIFSPIKGGVEGRRRLEGKRKVGRTEDCQPARVKDRSRREENKEEYSEGSPLGKLSGAYSQENRGQFFFKKVHQSAPFPQLPSIFPASL